MKKFIKIFIASLLIFAMVLPVSAEISLSEYVFKGLSDNADDQTIYTYTFGRFTGDPEEVGVKVYGNKDYKLSSDALTKAKANGGLFGIGLADTNNVLAGSTYKVIPYAITNGQREEGTGKEIDKNMEETVVDVPLQVTNITLTDYNNDYSFTTPDANTPVFETVLRAHTLKEPAYDTVDGNPVKTVFGSDMFTKPDVTAVHSDQNYFYTVIPDEMEGAYVIDTPKSFASTPDNYTIEFTLNKTAIFYFHNNPNKNVQVDGSIKLSEKICHSTDYYDTKAKAQAAEFDPSTIKSIEKDVWKYECVVPAGETKTFKFKLRTLGYFGPMLFIKE
ncbi:MAG: hypothetical protein E7419_06595 [Ruminococcaceae bacterium]|nr:hypothetical protein [Oscillospiraceae bacterium]